MAVFLQGASEGSQDPQTGAEAEKLYISYETITMPDEDEYGEAEDEDKNLIEEELEATEEE